MPYFSIIIPCLNEADYLPRLLQNLYQQIFTDFEVIVVDAYSPDDTLKIAKKYPANFPLKGYQTERKNVSYQRNLGATKASGKVLIFFDADTQIPKNYLSKLHHAFDIKHAHAVNTWVVPDTNKPSEKMIANGLNFFFEVSHIINKPTCCGAMIAVKKGVFEDVGGFDEITPYAEDTQFIQEVVKHNYKYILLSHPKYVYSLRRFRTEGNLEQISQFVKISINLIRDGFHNQKVDYPMGGHIFTKKAPKNSMALDFQKTIKRLTLASKSQQKSLTDFFKKTFS